jgi:hypothetical protein
MLKYIINFKMFIEKTINAGARIISNISVRITNKSSLKMIWYILWLLLLLQFYVIVDICLQYAPLLILCSDHPF